MLVGREFSTSKVKRKEKQNLKESEDVANCLNSTAVY